MTLPEQLARLERKLIQRALAEPWEHSLLRGESRCWGASWGSNLGWCSRLNPEVPKQTVTLLSQGLVTLMYIHPLGLDDVNVSPTRTSFLV